MESTSEIEINCCLSGTHLRNLIDNFLCRYLQVKRRMRRDAQLDSDEDEDEDGTNLCSAFEINWHVLFHTNGVALQMHRSLSQKKPLFLY